VLKILGMTVGAGRENNAFYMGINPIAASGGEHHIHATNLSWILIPSYYLKYLNSSL
jgi:hypothetical protein